MSEVNGVVVVEDVLTQECWRRVHFLGSDARQFQREWDRRLVAIPWESADAVITDRYKEAGIEHGVIHWPLRGAPVQYPNLADVSFHRHSAGTDGARPASGPKDETVVIWVLFGKDDRLSRAVKTCAWYHYAFYDVWPDTAWIGTDMDAHNGKTVEVDGHAMRLVTAEWMPKMGVGLGIQTEYRGTETKEK